MTTLRDAIAAVLLRDYDTQYAGGKIEDFYGQADQIVAAINAFFAGHPERVSELFGPGFKLVARDPTEAQVEAIRRAMSREKFVSHMRAIDCWTEGWLAAAPTMPSELVLVGEKS